MIVTPTENTKYMYSAVEYCTSLLFWETEVDYRYIEVNLERKLRKGV